MKPAWDEFALEAVIPSEARGLKIGRVIRNTLEPLRVDVAHALTSDSDTVTLSPDDALRSYEVRKWLPLTQCLARHMMKAEFPGEFLLGNMTASPERK